MDQSSVFFICLHESVQLARLYSANGMPLALRMGCFMEVHASTQVNALLATLTPKWHTALHDVEADLATLRGVPAQRGRCACERANSFFRAGSSFRKGFHIPAARAALCGYGAADGILHFADWKKARAPLVRARKLARRSIHTH